VTDRLERVAPGSVLVAGDGRRFEVRSSRPHQNAHIVAFAGVPDRNAAEGLRGTVLRAEPLDDPEALWVHRLVGARVVGVDGADHGVIEALEANPASDLLVLRGGGLVPLTFLVELRDDGDERIAVVDPPEGLFDA
jgi:16S rRNA processing protein RimM